MTLQTSPIIDIDPNRYIYSNQNSKTCQVTFTCTSLWVSYLWIGAIYYNPKVFGNAWMKANGFTEESMAGANMVKIFGFSYLFSVMIAFTLTSITIHQTHIFSLFMPDVMESGSALQLKFNE